MSNGPVVPVFARIERDYDLEFADADPAFLAAGLPLNRPPEEGQEPTRTLCCRSTRPRSSSTKPTWPNTFSHEFTDPGRPISPDWVPIFWSGMRFILAYPTRERLVIARGQ